MAENYASTQNFNYSRSIFVCNTAQRFYISYIYNKPIKKFYFIFSGLSLFTLVIVCVAEPNVDSGRVSLETTESTEGASLETTKTREGKGKFWNKIKVIHTIFLQ